MHVKQHVAVNTIVGSIALKIVDLPLIFSTLSPAVISGVLIDADHLLYEIWKQRTLSARKLLRGVLKDYHEHHYRFYLFHTIEFAIIFTLVVYRSPSLTWPWAFGYWVHLTSDVYYNYKLRRNIHWMSNWLGTLQGWRAIKARRSQK